MASARSRRHSRSAVANAEHAGRITGEAGELISIRTHRLFGTNATKRVGKKRLQRQHESRECGQLEKEGSQEPPTTHHLLILRSPLDMISESPAVLLIALVG